MAATPNAEPIEKKIGNVGNIILSLVPGLTVIAICVFWFFQGAIDFGQAELTIRTKIKLIIATVVLAMTIRNLIGNGGVKSAKNTDDYKQEALIWSDCISRGAKDKRAIEEKAKEQARINQKDLRRENLEKNGLSYEDFFDENGNFKNLNYKKNLYNKKKNPNGYTLHQMIIIKRCVNIRLVIPNLFGNSSSRFFGIHKQANFASWNFKNNIMDTIKSFILGFVSVGLMVKWLGISKESMIQALFQICMWLGLACVRRQKNYNYIINKILPQIVENHIFIKGFLDSSEEEKNKYRDIAKKVDESKKLLKIPLKTDFELIKDLQYQTNNK